MKKGEMAKRAERLTIWIVFLSIIGLIFMSFLPHISTAENDAVKGDLYFNFEMMKKSDNEQISDLADHLNLINISFWALVILGLLSFIGATIHASGKFSVMGNVILMVGCVTLIFSILVIDLQFMILENIGEMNIISASAIYSPMNYAYILLIPSFLIFICSVLYTWSTFSHSIQKFKDSKKAKKDKKEEKTTVEKPVKKKSKTKVKEPPKKEKPALEPQIDEKRVEMEQLLIGQAQDMEKESVEEKRPEPEKEEIITPKQPFEEEKIIEEPDKEPKEPHVFPSEKTKEKTEVTDEVRTSQSFEEALSSAIQKKQTEEEPEKTKEKEEPAEKEISVRCPQCKHIFTVEKDEGITKIKCPECGKEGLIK